MKPQRVHVGVLLTTFIGFISQEIFKLNVHFVQQEKLVYMFLILRTFESILFLFFAVFRCVDQVNSWLRRWTEVSWKAMLLSTLQINRLISKQKSHFYESCVTDVFLFDSLYPLFLSCLWRSWSFFSLHVWTMMSACSVCVYGDITIARFLLSFIFSFYLDSLKWYTKTIYDSSLRLCLNCRVCVAL